MGIETTWGLGYCGNEMIGQFVAGNDFNYTEEHARAIASSSKYSIASCSSEAIISGKVKMTDYHVVDLINGLERDDGYTHQYFKTFTPTMQKRIRYYALNGGKLLVSGSYNGSDMQTDEEWAALPSAPCDTYRAPVQPWLTRAAATAPLPWASRWNASATRRPATASCWVSSIS